MISMQQIHSTNKKNRRNFKRLINCLWVAKYYDFATLQKKKIGALLFVFIKLRLRGTK